jgi:chitin disaccharide deacetylase
MFISNRRIIVNADDFGMDSETNRAILDAFAKKLISSTTIMANMPGFNEACELAHRHQLIGKIGVHLNLTAGSPLSVPIAHCSRFCDGLGHFRPRQTCLRVSRKEQSAIETELAAQVQACIDRGIFPTHLDSHHHVHTEWPIGSATIRVAQRFHIHAIRLSRNCGGGISLARRMYKLIFNTRLRLWGLAKTRYFGSTVDTQQVIATTQYDIEIMVHPGAEVSRTNHLRTEGIESSLVEVAKQFASYP